MEILILIILIFVSFLYAILDNCFKSFSLLSLVKYIRDQKIKSFNKLNFKERHEQIGNALSAFAFTLKLFLFFYLLFYTVQNTFNKSLIPGLILLVLFILTFSFIIPAIAQWKRESILKWLLFIAKIPWIIFYPITKLFLSKKVINTNNDRKADNKLFTEKELEIFIEEGRKEGVIETEDKKMIESILEFGDILVKEIMTPRVDMKYVKFDDKIESLINIIRQEKRSRYPVIKGKIDNIIGMIISKDIYDFIDKKEDFSVGSILRPAYFIPETMRIMLLLNEMQKRKQKFAIVVDEFGGVSGIVTLEDIVEEIVGEIYDEFDKKDDRIFQKKDHFIVNGDTEITEINERLQIGLNEHEDFKTIAGLLSHKLGRIPKESDIISENNYIFEILKTDKNQVKQVRIYQENK